MPGVLSAVVALAGAGRPAAQRVAVFSADEATAAGRKDAWGTSEQLMFRCGLFWALVVVGCGAVHGSDFGRGGAGRGQ